MQNTPLYIKINDKIVITNPKIYLKDIAKVYCRDSSISKKVENMVKWLCMLYTLGVFTK